MLAQGSKIDPARPVRQILVIDDHPLVCEGLERIVEKEKDLGVCASANTPSAVFSAIDVHAPHVVLIDIWLGECDGIDLIRSIRARHASLPILVLSNREESIYAERMLSIGANGYLTKQASIEQIVAALRRVLDGGTSVSASVGSNIISGYGSRGPVVAGDPVDRLSNRERQILHMVGQGMSTRQAADSLSLSIKTVESHRQRLKRKLNLVTGTQLLQYAVNWFGDGRASGTARARVFARGNVPEIARPVLSRPGL